MSRLSRFEALVHRRSAAAFPRERDPELFRTPCKPDVTSLPRTAIAVVADHHDPADSLPSRRLRCAPPSGRRLQQQLGRGQQLSGGRAAILLVRQRHRRHPDVRSRGLRRLRVRIFARLRRRRLLARRRRRRDPRVVRRRRDRSLQRLRRWGWPRRCEPARRSPRRLRRSLLGRVRLPVDGLLGLPCQGWRLLHRSVHHAFGLPAASPGMQRHGAVQGPLSRP